MKTILVTGGLGFIGGHFVELALSKGYKVINIDKVTYASNTNFHPIGDHYVFMRKDVKDLEELPHCDYIVHFAAESHVDRSISNSDPFLESNVMGTYRILELLKDKKIEHMQLGWEHKDPVLIYIGTDEVFGDILEGAFKEDERHEPSNPYCLHPDTKILTKDGSIKRIDKICVSDFVFAYDFRNNTVTPRSVKKIWRKNVDENIRKISIKGHDNVFCSDDHTFFIKRPKRSKITGKLLSSNVPICEVRAKDIKSGDWILHCAKIDAQYDINLPENISKDFVKFLGYFSGDGYIKKSKNLKEEKIQKTIVLSDEKKDFVKYYNSFLANKGCIYKHKTKNCWYSQTGCIDVVNFIEENKLDTKARDKFVPEFIKCNGDIEVVKNFISGFFDADGCVVKKGNGCWISLTSYSDVLLDDLRFMLLRLGIWSKLDLKQHRLCIVSSEDCCKFCDVIGDKCLKEMIEVKSKPQNRNQGSGRWSVVISNEGVLYSGFLYDIEVGGLHNYALRSGLITHNSASKSCAEMLVKAWGRTYGLPYRITRTTNNYGERQHPEKLIPRCITDCMGSSQIPVHGTGEYIRNWIYVKDNCDAIMRVLERGVDGETYHISSDEEYSVIEIVNMITSRFHGCENLVEFVQNRSGQDLRYALDNTKIKRELGWKQNCTMEEVLDKIIEDYKAG